MLCNQYALDYSHLGCEINLKNQTINSIKVLEKDIELSGKGNGVFWKCKCLLCGKVFSVREGHLRHKTKTINSCGCDKYEIISKANTKNLIGFKNNLITIIAKDEKATKQNNNGHVYWIGQCECGRIVYNIKGSSFFKNGYPKSCGCTTFSSGEILIRNILEKNNIQYKKEYTFSDLYSQFNRRLRFDFGILNNKKEIKGIIEYNGEQHYKEIKGWMIKNGGFKRRKENDQLKISYCKKNNIPLLILRYDQKKDDIITDIEKFIKEVLE